MPNIPFPPTQVVSSKSTSSLPAWIAVSLLFIATSLCLVAKVGIAVRFGFPVGSFLIGIFLYRNYPLHFVGFCWWIWILTPLISRLNDHLTSWDPQRAIMVTPFLVSGITLRTLFRHVLNSNEIENFAFRFVLVGLLYGTLVGYVVSAPISVLRSLMEWIVPVSFGYHLFWNWRLYPKYADTLRSTFLWGVLVTGSYGIFQFMTAPEWDCKWLIETALVSLGKPEPFGIRVWSTMHAAAPFASFMMSGLLLLLSSQSPLQIPATIVGYLSLLLSLVRSAWLGWLIGLILMTSSIKLALQVRIIVLLIIIGIGVVPLSQMEPFADVIGTRLESMSDIENDSSFNARSSDLGGYIYGAISNPLGQGIGNVWVRQPNGALVQKVTDNGLVDALGTLGWIGTAAYVVGLLMLASIVFKAKAVRTDTFISAARGISLSFVIQMASTNSLIGIGGMFLWGFLGVVLSGERYYAHQQVLMDQYTLSDLILEEL
jgi:hypothetical protein